MTPAEQIDAIRDALTRAREADESLRGALAEATAWVAIAAGTWPDPGDDERGAE